MKTQIDHPTDDYDIEGWAAFYEANPHLRRSVGAEGDDNADDGGDDDAGKGGDDDAADEGKDKKVSHDTKGKDKTGKDKAGDKDGDDDTDGKGKGSDDDDGASDGAPENYDFKMPDGFEIVDEERFEAFADFARAHNLPQDEAQDLLDMGVATAAETVEAYRDAVSSQWDTLRDGWIKEVKEDPEYGGEKLEENLALCRKAVDAFGRVTEVKDEKGKPVKGDDGKPVRVNDLAQLLEVTGAGDHPAVVRLLSEVGKLVGEGGVIHGHAGNSKAPLGQRLFSKSNMNP